MQQSLAIRCKIHREKVSKEALKVIRRLALKIEVEITLVEGESKMLLRKALATLQQATD